MRAARDGNQRTGIDRGPTPAEAVADDRERLFFALWPDDRVRAAIRDQLPPMPKPARPVPPANWHATLAFLGDTVPERRRAYEEVARGLASRPFDLLLNRFGYFHRPRVLWLGASEVPDRLRALHADLNAALAEEGFEPESRPFTVHVTLARKMPPPDDLPPAEPVAWRVEDFVLVRSTLGRSGATYEVARRFLLAGA